MQGSDTGGGTLSRLNNGEAFFKKIEIPRPIPTPLSYFLRQRQEKRKSDEVKLWKCSLDSLLEGKFSYWNAVEGSRVSGKVARNLFWLRVHGSFGLLWGLASGPKSALYSCDRKHLATDDPRLSCKKCDLPMLNSYQLLSSTCIKWNTSALCCISFWGKTRLWHEGYYIDGKHMFYGFDIKFHIPSQEWLCHVVA